MEIFWTEIEYRTTAFSEKWEIPQRFEVSRNFMTELLTVFGVEADIFNKNS
jgi:hypothetical protein